MLTQEQIENAAQRLESALAHKGRAIELRDFTVEIRTLVSALRMRNETR